jgi:hypothetical protein
MEYRADYKIQFQIDEEVQYTILRDDFDKDDARYFGTDDYERPYRVCTWDFGSHPTFDELADAEAYVEDQIRKRLVFLKEQVANELKHIEDTAATFDSLESLRIEFP